MGGEQMPAKTNNISRAKKKVAHARSNTETKPERRNTKFSVSKTDRSHEMYCENQPTKEGYKVLSTIETYELEILFYKFLFLISFFIKLSKRTFFG